MMNDVHRDDVTPAAVSRRLDNRMYIETQTDTDGQRDNRTVVLLRL